MAQPSGASNQINSVSEPTMAMQSQSPAVPKIAAEDTSLTVNNADGGKTTFPVPAGTHIHFHVLGLHYNCTSGVFPSQDWSLLKSHSEVLEGSLQISAGEVPRGLAKGRVLAV
jgi:hypothetical protein